MADITIFGTTGMLGRYMYDYMSRHYTCMAVNRDYIDAASPDVETLHSIAMMSDVVINCVGVLKPDIKHVGVANTIQINACFPNILSEICNMYDTTMIHISSDCVFSGRTGGYIETDPPDVTDVYGLSKSMHPPTCLTLRTSFVGEELNSTKGLLSWVLSSYGEIEGYTNCLWNGVTCLQLCKIIKYKIDHGIDYTNNLLQHIHSAESVSKYDLCDMICDVYNKEIKIVPVEATSISGTEIEGQLNRTLSSNVSMCHDVPSLKQQLIDQKEYVFSK